MIIENYEQYERNRRNHYWVGWLVPLCAIALLIIMPFVLIYYAFFPKGEAKK